MGSVSFGHFRVDVEARRIFNETDEISVEPKVIDVLCYLMQNSNRFVSLQELHAEVWSGRVVTDTAVRRTISKLRAVLGDTDTDAPLYIKSQMKRGYQFIAQPRHPETPETASSAPQSDDVDLQRTTSQPPKHVLRNKPAFLWLVLLSIAVLAVVFWSYILIPRVDQIPVLTTEPLIDIQGEKMFLSVSENGRYQTFTARLNKDDGWQPYLYDRQLGQLQKITRSPNAESFYVSVVNNETVIVSTVENGESKLYLYAIANLNQVVRNIKLADFSVVGQVVPYQDNVVLIKGQKNSEKNVVYYLLNLDDETAQQFTFSSLNNSTDFGATLSPDHQFFAFIRRASRFEVQILRTADKSLIAKELYEFGMVSGGEQNLLWLDNQRLLINMGSKFEILNVVDGTKQEFPQSERFTGLGRDREGNVFGLLKQPKKYTFFQVAPTELNTIQRYFSFNEQAFSLNYSEAPDQLWLVEKKQTDYLLLQYYPDTGEKNLYFKSNEPFSVVAEQADSSSLLLQFNQNQLKMLNYGSGKLTDITDANQLSDFATFAGHNEILFSERIGGEWQINVFDRQTLLQTRLLKGYRLLLPWKEQFVAADTAGQFYLLDRQYQPVQSLELNINLNRFNQVNLRGNTLILAHLEADGLWRLTTLDLVSEQSQQQVSKILPIKSSFSFSHDGTKAIVMAENVNENQLVEIGYSFGYN